MKTERLCHEKYFKFSEMDEHEYQLFLVGEIKVFCCFHEHLVTLIILFTSFCSVYIFVVVFIGG